MWVTVICLGEQPSLLFTLLTSISGQRLLLEVANLESYFARGAYCFKALFSLWNEMGTAGDKSETKHQKATAIHGDMPTGNSPIMVITLTKNFIACAE